MHFPSNNKLVRLVVMIQNNYSAVQKTPLISLDFPKEVGLSRKFLKWSWAKLLEAFWMSLSSSLDIGCFFIFSPVHVPDHFQRTFLSHLTPTYESFKHKKTSNSRDELVLSLHTKDSLENNWFSIVSLFLAACGQKHHLFQFFRRFYKIPNDNKVWHKSKLAFLHQ